MITESKKIYTEEIAIECACGNEIMEISQWDDGEVFINLKGDLFSANYHPIRRALQDYFKRLWYVLTGKQYVYFELVLNPEDIKKLKEAISKLKEEV